MTREVLDRIEGIEERLDHANIARDIQAPNRALGEHYPLLEAPAGPIANRATFQIDNDNRESPIVHLLHNYLNLTVDFPFQFTCTVQRISHTYCSNSQSSSKSSSKSNKLRHKSSRNLLTWFKGSSFRVVISQAVR